MNTRTSSILALLLIVAFSASCDRRAAKLEQRNQDILAKLSKMDLASSSQKKLDQAPPAVRVWVRRDGIDVDDLAIWKGLTNKDLDWMKGKNDTVPEPVEKRAIALKDYTLPDGALRGSGGYLIKALGEALKDIRQNERQIAELKERRFRGDAVVIVEPQANFYLLSRVLYSLGMSEYSQNHFAVRTDAGARVLKSSAPKFCDESNPEAVKPDICLGVTVAVTDSGVAWKMEEDNQNPCILVELAATAKIEDVFKDVDVGEIGLSGALGKKAKKAPDIKIPPPPPVPVEKDKCPILPRKSGKLDIAGLEAKLSKRPKDPPPCSAFLLGGTERAQWRELVEVADALARQGFSEFTLFVPIDEDCPF